MPFKKGQPKVPGSGRKKGVKSRIKQVTECLLEEGVNPIEEIIKIIPRLEPVERLEAWFALLSYCQAKPKADASDSDSDSESDDELLEAFKDLSNADLLEFVKKDERKRAQTLDPE